MAEAALENDSTLALPLRPAEMVSIRDAEPQMASQFMKTKVAFT